MSIDQPTYTLKDLLKSYGTQIFESLNLKEKPTIENFEKELYIL